MRNKVLNLLGLLIAFFLVNDSCITNGGTFKAIDPRKVIVEPKIVLTPKPGPFARINGARIFGVRPDSPFLFAIPATF